MSLRTEYDAWHQRVLAADPRYEDAASPWYQLVREQIGVVSGLRVLEIACGRGGYVRELARAGAEVIGGDFSFRALQAAAERSREGGTAAPAALIQSDAQNLPFADNSFDVLISCETVEHLPFGARSPKCSG